MTKLPTASVILLAYNQEQYVREAAIALLAQDCEPTEILFSDDCSTDRTFEILTEVAQAYKGRHRVTLNRNVQNLGISAHLALAVSKITGEWIVVAAGDDVSAPNRVRVIIGAVQSKDKACGAISHYHLIDQNGEQSVVSPRQIRQMRLMQDWSGIKIISAMTSVDGSMFWMTGAAAAWRRSVFDRFQPLPSSRTLNEDIVLMMRALMLGGIVVVEDDLLAYRRHDGALSRFTGIIGRSEGELLRARAAFQRTKASLEYSISDARFAGKTGLITVSKVNSIIESIERLLSYKQVVAEWPWMSTGGRILALLRMWRPNRLRPGIRRLFEQRLS